MKTHEFLGAMGLGVGAFFLAPKQELFTVGDFEFGVDDAVFLAVFFAAFGFGRILRGLKKSL